MRPEATAIVQQMALRVLATERVEAFDPTLLMDDRNLLVRRHDPGYMHEEPDEDEYSDEEPILVPVQLWELQRCRCDITKMSLGAYRPKNSHISGERSTQDATNVSNRALNCR